MGKKKRREGRLIRGDELLEQRGIDLDAPDETLFPALMAAMNTHPDADLSIADWLGTIATEESAGRLQEWERSQPPDKDLRRIIRSSLFRLEQRGVTGAQRQESGGEPVRLIERIEPVGYLSPLDGAGNRLAWISQARPAGGLLLLSSFINDRTGMRQFDSFRLNKSELKQRLADAASHQVPMVTAPAGHVDWLMYEAHRKAAPREGRGNYPLQRSDIFAEPATESPLPLDEMVPPASAEQSEKRLEDSAGLFHEPEYMGWAIQDELVKVHQARLRDAQDSTLVLSKAQMSERLTGVIDKAFDEVFASDARGLYARRMREMAFWYALAGRREPAAASREVALALSDPGRELGKVSFLHTLVFRAFIHLLPRDREDKEPADRDGGASLIVPPD